MDTFTMRERISSENSSFYYSEPTGGSVYLLSVPIVCQLKTNGSLSIFFFSQRGQPNADLKPTYYYVYAAAAADRRRARDRERMRWSILYVLYNTSYIVMSFSFSTTCSVVQRAAASPAYVGEEREKIRLAPSKSDCMSGICLRPSAEYNRESTASLVTFYFTFSWCRIVTRDYCAEIRAPPRRLQPILVPNHALQLLSRLLEDRTNKLKEHLNRLVNQANSFDMNEQTIADNLYEDLHWLVLIAGHVLCMEADGETPLIPSEIMRYSMNQIRDGSMDINVTLQLFASPQSNISDIAGAEQSADHVIRLTAAVFRLSEVTKIDISYNAAQHLSPELCSSILWFMHRWSLSYLMIKETNYNEISTTLLEAFGEESQGSPWTLNFLVDKIICHIQAFKGEAAVTDEIRKLILSLVNVTNK
ncbi:unnamed protein product [Trichogramma brassicae]|uniref:Uncharacterized protein n=1 Tax=Trichogramma brassicae TaxID=86971 RepID=A0A6H5HW65_9HYME|nr:unnamed protein product [Trichogramma brassicae]